MPAGRDLRWRVIWMKEVLAYKVNEVAASLSLSPRTVEGRHKPRGKWKAFEHCFYALFHVRGISDNGSSANTHPEKTLAEIAHEVYVQIGSQYTLAGVFS